MQDSTSSSADAQSNMSPPAGNASRYQRIKDILNAAQGGFDASYQGYGRFWELPLTDFLKVALYGIAMIAPWGEPAAVSEPAACNCGPKCGCEPECDCHAGDTAPSQPNCKGRGAASGLIKALRGLAPFDGTQFPPMMWGQGAQRVAEADIQFIADWIDDCCPESDSQLSKMQVREHDRAQLANGDKLHVRSDKALNSFKGYEGHVRVRKNIESLTDVELSKFRAAIAQMQSLDRYSQDERSFQYWARMHADMCEHGWEQFATWHRAYLYYFEQRLQDIDPEVTLPYWDWTMYAAQNKQTAGATPPANGGRQTSNDTGIIPKQYGCWIDDAALEALNGKIPKDVLDQLASVKGRLFMSGNRLYEQANLTYTGTSLPDGTPTVDDLIMAELQRANPLWHRQRWPGMNSNMIPHYPTPDDVERILQMPDFAHWGGGPASDHYFGALESVHNYMHNFSGGLNPNFKAGMPEENFYEPKAGHMVEARVTAFDPLFWAHHSNVDRLWAKWQELHANVNPQALDSPLPPFALSVRDTLSTSGLGYEYMQDAHYFPTDNTLSIKRFRSEAVPVSDVALIHRRAEVRLHDVQVTQHAASIRVFLNQPDATADTSMDGNPHFVGQFTTFTGLCYGGPGHCAVPPRRPRVFDHRMRHHKTPNNVRFDATHAVRALLNKHDGQSPQPFSIDITVVVTDLEGRPNDDLLKLDGVSLSFIH